MPYPLNELGALGWSDRALTELRRLTGREIADPLSAG